jgi:hypothetical protein
VPFPASLGSRLVQASDRAASDGKRIVVIGAISAMNRRDRLAIAAPAAGDEYA